MTAIEFEVHLIMLGCRKSDVMGNTYCVRDTPRVYVRREDEKVRFISLSDNLEYYTFTQALTKVKNILNKRKWDEPE